ncbi:MAG: hypothetical protein IIA33_11220 [Planctomycetes bacterium]|nr:hypothetical protein [Planctomycetota bacterium]
MLAADKPKLGALAAARALRTWLKAKGEEAPSVQTIRGKFLYAVRDAVEGEPEYVAAYLIHSRAPLKFSHPDRIMGIEREPRVSASGVIRAQKEAK